MSEDPRVQQGLLTLRYVRLMLLVMPLLLVVAIGAHWALTGEIEGSISAYYLSPARDLFVAMMVTIGILLVVYKGSLLEDYALNFAGFYAMFVAIVPTNLAETLDQLDADKRLELILSIRVGVVAVVIVSIVFTIFDLKERKWTYGELLKHPWTRRLTWASFLPLVLFLLLLVGRTIEGKDFAGVHFAATILLIASMAVAVASHLGSENINARDTSGGKPGRYKILLVVMALGVFLGAGLILMGFEQAVFVAECIEIGAFFSFWLFETRRKWSVELSPGTNNDDKNNHVLPPPPFGSIISE